MEIRIQDHSNENYTPVKVSDYYPKVVVRLLNRVANEKFNKIVLFGFCHNMKWLLRLLSENSIDPILCDWRKSFIKYDCGGKNLVSIDSIEDSHDTLLIVCLEEINLLKEGIGYLQNLQKNKIRVIYDRSDSNLPFRQEEPFKSISEKAGKRAVSMLEDARLFDLIQFISQTKNVDGDIVEFGTLHGGSGAVIAEAVKYFGEKRIWLFDTFEGIPESKYGLDYHWNGSFSDNSYAEVCDAFSDMPNVKVIRGNICETYNTMTNSISFGYLASDTYESGEILLDFMWDKLNPGGIICVCDYGSFPNALPLTVYVDEFLKDKSERVFTYRPETYGIFILKK